MATGSTHPRYPDVQVELSDLNGNVFVLAGECGRTAGRSGVPRDEIESFYAEVSRAGSYDTALRVMMEWFDVS